MDFGRDCGDDSRRRVMSDGRYATEMPMFLLLYIQGNTVFVLLVCLFVHLFVTYPVLVFFGSHILNIRNKAFNNPVSNSQFVKSTDISKC